MRISVGSAPLRPESVQVKSPTRTRRGPIATTIRVLGEILLTFGVVLILFGAYELWWTNVVAAQATQAARQQVENTIETKNSPGWEGGQPPLRTPFALLYIPRLRDDVWALPIIQGVTLTDLARGVGHYVQTALPGQVGNFAVAGHRATQGAPFAYFDRLRVGDKLYVATRESWFTYELRRQMIFSPSDIWSIDPQPFPTNPLPSQQLITLTTCYPRWSSTQRWAFWGILTGTQPRSAGPPSEIAR